MKRSLILVPLFVFLMTSVAEASGRGRYSHSRHYAPRHHRSTAFPFHFGGYGVRPSYFSHGYYGAHRYYRGYYGYRGEGYATYYRPVYYPRYYAPTPVYVPPPVVVEQPVYIAPPQQLIIPQGFRETGRRYHRKGHDAGTVDWLKGMMADGRSVKIEYNLDGTIRKIKGP